MKTKMLNDNWNMRIIGENVFHLDNEFMEANVPGSVYGTLLDLGKIPDPFYRDNELQALKLMENDFEYETSFHISKELLECDAVLLRFDGIDTLAEVYLNDILLGEPNNMHRIWEYDITGYTKDKDNKIRVVLHSPTKFIAAENEICYTGGSWDSMDGYPHLRKAHCMFGWDWGPRLPDAGIWRNVSLIGVEKCRFEQVYITQKHSPNQVELDFDVQVEAYADMDIDEAISITVIDPAGNVFTQNKDGLILIPEPKLWWPNGYGEQPLYTVKAVITGENNTVLDMWERRIGLRTMKVKQEKDQWGESFAHEVNGVTLFAMGADYIPEDNIFSRITEERTRKLLLDCVAVNYNSIRVWGGGYYPDDYFFDICDELGLMVWQDFMYACASYELNDEFEENIRMETIDNVRRIRHHACLALWCGNNEMETQTLDKAWKPSQKQTYDYIKLFEYIIPNILKEEDPNAFYWPSSPSSGGNFDNHWNENIGDTHYWDVWHGEKPFSDFRKYYFRYLSEFGFQSFPSLKTVETFTEEKDRNVFSRVMEMHQRNRAANGKILNYLSATYLYPKDFEHLLYASQLLQADAIKYGVEHFRRNRGRCMGTVVWQLNDIWPVASWASIDYYGRWKALHYAQKRMFAPIMISCEEIGEMTQRPFCIMEPKPIEKSVRLNITNETRNVMEGTVKWALRLPTGDIIKSGEEKVAVPELSSLWLNKMDFSDCDELNNYFSYELYIDQTYVSGGTCLFTAPKHFGFLNPNLTYRIDGNQIFVNSANYAKYVEIEGVDGDLKLSDNFFDINGGEVAVTILEGTATKLKIKSVYDIAN